MKTSRPTLPKKTKLMIAAALILVGALFLAFGPEDRQRLAFFNIVTGIAWGSWTLLRHRDRP